MLELNVQYVNPPYQTKQKTFAELTRASRAKPDPRNKQSHQILLWSGDVFLREDSSDITF